RAAGRSSPRRSRRSGRFRPQHTAAVQTESRPVPAGGPRSSSDRPVSSPSLSLFPGSDGFANRPDLTAMRQRRDRLLRHQPEQRRVPFPRRSLLSGEGSPEEDAALGEVGGFLGGVDILDGLSQSLQDTNSKAALLLHFAR